MSRALPDPSGTAASTGSTAGGGVRARLLAAARQELALVGTSGISLRAIARRAGVSHAAPKHHFGDRAGLLTALATEGFQRLSTELQDAGSAAPAPPPDQLAALGRAYLDRGLRQPALFELMFRPELLHRDDPNLRRAQQSAFGLLHNAASDTAGALPGPPGPGEGELALLAWAFVHGLVALIRDQAITVVSPTPDTDTETGADTAQLAHQLIDAFVDRVQR